MAKETTTKLNWSTYRASVPVNTPFSLYLKKRTTENAAIGDTETPPAGEEIGLAFVQGFVIDYLKLQQESNAADDPDLKNERMAIVENMDKVFEIELDDESRIFEVQIDLNEDGSIKKANFQKKPRDETEENFRPPEDKVDTFNVNSDLTCGKVFLPVCEVLNGNVIKVWLRDNIHWWGELLGDQSKPFVPRVKKKETGTDWELTYNIGAVNTRIPDDYGVPKTMTQAQYDKLQYLYLSVDIVDNQVYYISYNFQDTVIDTFIDPVSEGSVPSKINIPIGSLYKGGSKMIYNKNLTLEPYVWIIQKKQEGVVFGQYPFLKYWKYKVTES